MDIAYRENCLSPEDFIRLREGLTRINVKVKASDEETEINASIT